LKAGSGRNSIEGRYTGRTPHRRCLLSFSRNTVEIKMSPSEIRKSQIDKHHHKTMTVHIRCCNTRPGRSGMAIVRAWSMERGAGSGDFLF
jgi:hypothetical protein